MKKILIRKEDSVAEVVEKVLDAKDENVVLVIPRGSALAEAVDHFHMLHDEAKKAEKNVFIETVDAKALAMAKAAKIDAANPFFVGPRRSVSDIVVAESDASSDQEAGETVQEVRAGADVEENLDVRIDKTFKQPRLRRSRRRLFVFSVVFVFLVGSGIVAAQVLPRADIQIVMKKVPWTYADAVQVPVQIFSQTKSMQKAYPASEQKSVAEYATGSVTLYNAYSSAPQTLVGKTRLETPDKKIFRLQKDVTVPGAQIGGGKIIPSSITADVVADKSGEAYNIGPVDKFVIPGFREANSPKYVGFYAKSDAPMTGGFAGETWYPSKTDLAAAKKDMEGVLHDTLVQVVETAIPTEMTALTDSTKFVTTKEQIVEEPTKQKEFTLLAEGTVSIPAYRESDILAALEKTAAAQIGDGNTMLTHTLQIASAAIDFSHAMASISTTFSATFEQNVDVSTFKQRAAGKEEIDLRALVFSLPGIESAKISLWPLWVHRVPADPQKISISID